MALCKNLAEVEFAGLGWVEGFNNRRFEGPIRRYHAGAVQSDVLRTTEASGQPGRTQLKKSRGFPGRFNSLKPQESYSYEFDRRGDPSQ